MFVCLLVVCLFVLDENVCRRYIFWLLGKNNFWWNHGFSHCIVYYHTGSSLPQPPTLMYNKLTTAPQEAFFLLEAFSVRNCTLNHKLSSGFKQHWAWNNLGKKNRTLCFAIRSINFVNVCRKIPVKEDEKHFQIPTAFLHRKLSWG